MNTPAPYLFSKLIFIFVVNITLLVTHSWGQANNQTTSGAIILLSSKGLVQVLDPLGNQVAGPLNPGTVLAEGFSVKTGFAGEVSVLFSNGTVATIEPRTQITIESFLQKPFDAANRNVSDLLGEPSSSQLKINLGLVKQILRI